MIYAIPNIYQGNIIIEHACFIKNVSGMETKVKINTI